jgi:crotonobetainyl-CoA:carnitine CoA-transferase CaiB-like acyl-CoA transferase
MDAEGVASDFMKNFDWESLTDPTKATPEILGRINEETAKFFMSHTIDEILRAAGKYRFTCSSYSTFADVLKSPQLAFREFWVKLEHPELGTSITYPGAFTHATEAPPRLSRRAPLIGEHNEEIYEKELGLSKEELVTLKQARVI